MTDKTDESLQPKLAEAGAFFALTPSADTLPRLPWQLERLVRAASSNVLTVVLPGVPNVPRYTVALRDLLPNW